MVADSYLWLVKNVLVHVVFGVALSVAVCLDCTLPFLFLFFFFNARSPFASETLFAFVLHKYYYIFFSLFFMLDS